MVKLMGEPSDGALAAHREACEAEEAGYTDPETGLFVMTSYYLRERGYCCGNGCRHCPFSAGERQRARRPEVGAWPWPEDES